MSSGVAVSLLKDPCGSLKYVTLIWAMRIRLQRRGRPLGAELGAERMLQSIVTLPKRRFTGQRCKRSSCK